MASLLKSTKLVSSVTGFIGRRFFERGKRHLFLEYPRVTNFYELRRTAVSVAVKENTEWKEEHWKTEELIYHLNRNIKSNNILLEDVEIVLNSLKEKGGMTDSQLLLLLKCCSEVAFMSTNKERIQLAEDIWSFAEKLGILFDISHYNALLNVFLENNHNFKPAEFFGILKKKNIEPNKTTYRYLLKAYCQQGDIEGASEILVKMKESDCPLSVEDFNSLIQGHCEIGDFAKAAELLKVMESRSIRPGSGSYAKLLLGYSKHQKLDEFQKLLNKLSEEKIVLKNSDLLDVMYALAINNQMSQIQSIKEMLTPERDRGMYFDRFIQKLLHKKLDSLALEIFEHSISSDLSEEVTLSRAKFILKHFVLYREANKVLDMCKNLEKRGWTKGALSYALKNILITKDDIIALRFLNVMKQRGMEVRSHYYWPIIIKSSYKSPKWMRYILRKVPKQAYNDSFEMTHKIIFPNYHFNRIKTDLDFLTKLGINPKLINFCFVEKELLNRNIKGAEELLLSQNIVISRWKHLINCVISCLTSEKENESFLNILKTLGHDYYYSLTVTKKGDRNESQDEDENLHTQKEENMFDFAINTLIKRVKSQEQMTGFLQGMLKRKLGISSTTANVIASSFDSEEIRNLANKLASPEASFEFDGDIVCKKIWKIPNHLFSKVSDPVKDLAVKDLKTGTGFQEFQSLGSGVSVVDSVFFAIVLMRRAEPMKSLQILENMGRLNADFGDEPQCAKLLLNLLMFEMAIRYPENLTTAFDLAEKAKFPEQYLSQIYLNLLSKLNVDRAIDLFCNYGVKHKIKNGLEKLLMMAAREKKTKCIHRLLEASSDIIPSEKRATYLAIALATSGDVKNAKRVLQQENVELEKKQFYTHCTYYYNSLPASVLENYLELVKNTQKFDRTPLYKMIILKCAEYKNIAKALEVCKTIEEENIPDYYILKEIRPFLAEPTLKRLQELVKSFEEIKPGKEFRFGKQDLFEEIRIQNTKQISLSKLRNAAAEGNISEVFDILKKNEGFTVTRAANYFLRTGHVKEYLDLLEKHIVEGKFSDITYSFNLQSILKYLKNDEVFKKYETLAIRCLEEGFITTPLIHLFVNSIKIPCRVSQAEAYAERFSAHFTNVPFHEICEEAVRSGLGNKFWENFVANDGLKQRFAFHIHLLYDKLINANCETSNLDSALRYLHMAVSDAVGKNLDRNILHSLSKKLERKGKSFPYPELLSTS